ncbi:MAG: hypothetical protein ACREP4_03930 [Stenotrophomonas sp.]|uniref:hypothetical protein n=1 Tax=Stenotrophomonas sp. TaxID=69392 RepID=UPI003D6CB2B6
MKAAHFLYAALLSTSAMASAQTGTVRFSGRVVDPVCVPSLSGQQHLQLDACPASAKDLRVTIHTQESDASTAELIAKTPQLSARVSGTGDLTFSDRYRIEPPESGTYLVVIDYP